MHSGSRKFRRAYPAGRRLRSRKLLFAVLVFYDFKDVVLICVCNFALGVAQSGDKCHKVAVIVLEFVDDLKFVLRAFIVDEGDELCFVLPRFVVYTHGKSLLSQYIRRSVIYAAEQKSCGK